MVVFAMLSEAKYLYCIVCFVIFGFRTFVVRFPYLVILSIHKNTKNLCDDLMRYFGLCPQYDKISVGMAKWVFIKSWRLFIRTL